MAELNLAASLKDLTILSGGQASVNYGGKSSSRGKIFFLVFLGVVPNGCTTCITYKS